MGNRFRRGKKAGIPVIIVDRNIATERTDLFLTHIGSSFKAQGDEQAYMSRIIIKKKRRSP